MDSTKARIKPMLETKKELSEDDMEKFGKKDPEAYPFRTHVMYIHIYARTYSYYYFRENNDDLVALS